MENLKIGFLRYQRF